MKKILPEIVGVVLAFIIWWAAALLLGMLAYAIWPPEGSYTAGLSLEPQNIPGNLLGFVLALYVFRSVTSKRRQHKNSSDNSDE